MLDVSAHNTANITNREAHAQGVSLTTQPDRNGVRATVHTTDAPPELVTETVSQMTAGSYMKASAQVVRAQDQMRGQFLDLFA